MMTVSYKTTFCQLRAFLLTFTTGFLTSGILLSGILLWSRSANAQVASDNTTNTIVNPIGNNFTILNGIEKGNNLFHSFSNFSVPKASTASFNLVKTPNITTIFSRVTGSSVSNIDGLIRILNSTNPVSLFLMNPNGIIFGPNAKLDIGGSFVGTTANSIKFANGTEFSTTNSTTTPLLTMSAPIGLQFGQNPGAIQVSATSLRVPPQKTLALIGGDIQLQGGQIQSPGSHVTLAGIAGSGTIGLNLDSSHLRFSLPSDVTWANVSLTKAAQVNVSDKLGGSIRVNARNLSLAQGSKLQAGISGIGSVTAQSGDIDINTSETVDLNDSTISNDVTSPTSRGRSGNINIMTDSLRLTNGARLTSYLRGQGSAGNINIESGNQIILDGSNSSGVTGIFGEVLALAVGNVGEINLTTRSLALTNGARIANNLRGKGNTGTVNIQASETVSLDGIAPTGGETGIFGEVNANGIGTGSTINITTASLTATNGAQIGVSTRSRQGGNAGDVNIQATNKVLFQGASDNSRSAGIFSQVIKNAVGNGGNINVTAEALEIGNGALFDATTSGRGEGGNITLRANTVQLLKGGQVAAISEGSGNAGQIAIDAKNSLTIAGTDSIGAKRAATGRVTTLNAASGIYASAVQGSTGAGGSIQLTTGELTVQDDAQVNVSSLASGNAGNLKISADRVRLDTAGSLRADVQAGSEGNITIATNRLLMRRGSQITTNAGANANGGNITINSPIIVGWENSDIIANAVKGRGGNIQITTQGIFGLKYRDRLTPESDITASSQFGVNGKVDINNFGVDPNSGLVELPANVTDPSQQIASGCSANQGSSFVATGRGGIPQNPNQEVRSDVYDGLGLRTWSDIRDLSAYRKTGEITAQIPPSPEILIQATSWHRKSDGKIQLIADKSSALVQQALTCAAVPKS
jgi:filamentous hemagglutinin family protein